jgi:hypothetical protein
MHPTPGKIYERELPTGETWAIGHQTCVLSLECFGGSVTRFGILTLPQKYIDVWSGNLKDLPDPTDLAKTQKLHIATVINNDFIKSTFELFLC